MRKQIPIAVLLLPFLAACSEEAPKQQSAGPAPAAPAATTPDRPPAAPQSPSSAQAQSQAPGAGQQAQAPTSNPATPVAAGGAAQGESVYKQTCSACHAAGVAGAPKLGDKADWQPRVAQGMDVLYEHSIKGYQGKKGFMPPKGGNMSLSDQQVKTAVDYMVAQAK